VSIPPVLECQRSAVSFGDLAAQDQTDPRSPRLCGEEGYKQVAGIREAGAFIIYPDLNPSDSPPPSNYHSTTGLQRGVYGVAEKIDQQLLELIPIRADRSLRTGCQLDIHSSLEADDALDERGDAQRLESRQWKPRESRVSFHEPIQRRCP